MRCAQRGAAGVFPAHLLPLEDERKGAGTTEAGRWTLVVCGLWFVSKPEGQRRRPVTGPRAFFTNHQPQTTDV